MSVPIAPEIFYHQFFQSEKDLGTRLSFTSVKIHAAFKFFYKPKIFHLFFTFILKFVLQRRILGNTEKRLSIRVRMFYLSDNVIFP